MSLTTYLKTVILIILSTIACNNEPNYDYLNSSTVIEKGYKRVYVVTTQKDTISVSILAQHKFHTDTLSIGDTLFTK